MNAQAELRDIHLPAEVSWFPPALGWWLLLALLLTGLYILFRLYKKRQTNKPTVKTHWRPVLQDELQAIQQQYADQQNQQQLAIQLSELLRKTVVTESANEQLAGLTGQAWLEALDQHFAMEGEFSLSASALTEAPYNPTLSFDADKLLDLVQRALSAQQEAEHA